MWKRWRLHAQRHVGHKRARSISYVILGACMWVCSVAFVWLLRENCLPQSDYSQVEFEVKRPIATYRNFKWSDFMDFTLLPNVDLENLDEDEFPELSQDQDEERYQPLERIKSTQQEYILRGELYAGTKMAPPSRIVYLNDPRAVDYEKQPAQFSLVQQPENVDCPVSENVEVPKSMGTDLVLGPELFKRNVHDFESGCLSERVPRLIQNSRHAPKYFYETRIFNDSKGRVNHYDWRFFKGHKRAENMTVVNHHMARVWSQFAEAYGFHWWLSHGSLIGWYWNGMMLPWDRDNDLQMPLADFDRLSKFFNNTLVIENPSEGNGRYLIDINPNYFNRCKANGKNKIDGRLIDVNSGAYIDLTALALFGHPNKAFAKDTHRIRLPTTGFPVYQTMYEGARAYVPRDWRKLLSKEYKYFEDDYFNGFMFNPKLRIWYTEETCEERTKDKPKDAITLCFPEKSDIVEGQECDAMDEEYGTCDLEVLKHFEKTRKYTELHQEHRMLLAEGHKSNIRGYVPPFL